MNCWSARVRLSKDSNDRIIRATHTLMPLKREVITERRLASPEKETVEEAWSEDTASPPETPASLLRSWVSGDDMADCRGSWTLGDLKDASSLMSKEATSLNSVDCSESEPTS